MKRALVLGEMSTARLIAAELRENGIEPIFQRRFLGGEALPSVGDSKGVEQMKALLGKFAAVAGTSGWVHPGVTPWAERAELPILAEQMGLTVMGPSSKILSLFSNKLSLLRESARLGIPNVVLHADPMVSVREVEKFIRDTGKSFPFVLKAVKGRGSASLLVLKDEQTLQRDLTRWLDQLRKNVGEVMVLAEKYVDGARHVAVPFVRFQNDAFSTFPMVDHSLQSQYRKMVEICPAGQIDPEVSQRLVRWTETLARELNYVGVGIFEFLVDGYSAYLVEGLPRLNAGFHLWEKIGNIKAVSLQWAALQSPHPPDELDFKRIEGSAESQAPSYGISFRIYAEDSYFHLPSPGRIVEVLTPEPPLDPESSVEYWLNYQSGEQVSISDSGIIGLFFVLGQNRSEVMSRALQVIHEFWIVGNVQTNQYFLSELLQHPWVREEIFNAGFVDEEFLPNLSYPSELKAVFLELKKVCQNWPVNLPDLYRVFFWAESPRFLKEEQIFWGKLQLSSGMQLRMSIVPLLSGLLVRVGNWYRVIQKKVDPDQQGVASLQALVSGRVHAVFFLEGAQVAAHEPLMMIEAFGVLIPHSLPVGVRIQRWLITPEACVEMGQRLAELEIPLVVEELAQLKRL